MIRSIKISLDPVHFGHRISERMAEIGNSIYYHELYDRPEIVLFTIDCSHKNSEREIMEAIKKASFGIPYLPYLINGFLRRTPEKNHGLSLAVWASPEIEKFCSELESILTIKGEPFRKLRDDKNRLYIPLMPYPGLLDSEVIIRHAENRKMNPLTRLISFGRKRPAYKIREFVLPAESFRIVLSDDGGFLKTYDLVLKRWTDRNDIYRSKESFGQFRRIRGYESFKQRYSGADDCFVISDLHLGHKAIIGGAARPYYPGDSKKMDEILIRNWNNRIKKSDTVWYLGDLTYNLDFDTCNAYLSQLNGEIVFISGNHDACMAGCPEKLMVSYSGREYLLIHDPKFRPEDHSGWMIHGHVHNSRIADYPFIDFKKRTINTCCELTGYHPVSLRDINRIIDMFESGKITGERYLLYEELPGLNQKSND